MLRRRAAIEHGERDAGAFGPVISVGLGKPATGGQSRFDQVETLIEAVAAKTDVARILPDRLDPIIGLDHILTTDRERIHSEQFTQFVNRAFDSESGLRSAIAPKAAAG
jgi:hypothetical protein